MRGPVQPGYGAFAPQRRFAAGRMGGAGYRACWTWAGAPVMFAPMETSGTDIILDQVRRLVAIPAEAAPEGVVFYCARMLDGISRRQR